jgi:hypothetical protein
MSDVTALRGEAARPADARAPGRFEVDYLTVDRAVRGAVLEDVWSAPFERALPVRRFVARKGQQHLSGLWWSVTTGGHVGFESWLERDHVMLLDFDAAVTGIASQPFWLRWHDQTGTPVSHVPDFFARRADGSAVVVDCRPAERRGPRDAAKFEATGQACARVGWEYRLVGAADPVVTLNVRWLAGYRHPRHHQPGPAEALRQVFASPVPLMAGAEAAGDPIAVLPVLFHLLWRHELAADLSLPLHPGTLVSPGTATR